MKIILLGNIVLDTIFYLNHISSLNKSNPSFMVESNIGGIGNNIKFFNNIKELVYVDTQIGDDLPGKHIKKNLKSKFVNIKNINLSKSFKTSVATVVIDRNNEKTSYVNWDSCQKKIFKTKYKNAWCHFSYIELLEGLNLSYLKSLRENKCIISADMCSSFYSKSKKINIFKYIKYLDFLIISDNEAHGLFSNNKNLYDLSKKLGKLVTDHVIIHHSKGSFYSNGEYVKQFKIPMKQLFNTNKYFANLNGIGDFFCSAVLFSLSIKLPVDKAIHLAHNYCLKYIQKNLK